MIFVLAGGVILQWRYNHELRGELMALRNELAQTREESAQLRAESFWETVGWDTLKSDSDNSVAGLLTHEQAEALLQALKQTKEAEGSNRLEASLVEGEKATFGWTTTDAGGSTLLS